MLKIVVATKTGLCPEPRDFFRHVNIPKKPENEKVEAKHSDFFVLSPDYSLKGCVHALPSSASSDNLKYSILFGKISIKNKRGLPSAVKRSIMTISKNELEAQNSQEANHE